VHVVQTVEGLESSSAVPAMHGTHSSAVCAGAYWPFGHAVQPPACPATEKNPAAQSAHGVAPLLSASLWPAVHDAHENTGAIPPAEYLPGRQPTQAEVDWQSWSSVPAAHSCVQRLSTVHNVAGS
jgi:hypothetical protein